tara:strand:- start:955 stop:1248 length:294 start_codon:yes stop_codon:yes gene_type:complete
MDIASAVRVIGSLIVVFLLLVFFLYYLRRFRLSGFSQNNGEVEVLAKTYIDATKQVVLVRARGNESLLAVSGNQVEHLWTEKVAESQGVSSGLSQAE